MHWSLGETGLSIYRFESETKNTSGGHIGVTHLICGFVQKVYTPEGVSKMAAMVTTKKLDKWTETLDKND